MEIVTTTPTTAAELQRQLEDERKTAGELYLRVQDLEAQLAQAHDRLARQEGHLRSLIRFGDQLLEQERRENGRLRAELAKYENAERERRDSYQLLYQLANGRPPTEEEACATCGKYRLAERGQPCGYCGAPDPRSRS